MIEEKIAYHADKGEIVPTRDMLKTIPQIEGIQKSAEKYIADINREVQSYENNIVGIGKKIEDLSDAISELQQ